MIDCIFRISSVGRAPTGIPGRSRVRISHAEPRGSCRQAFCDETLLRGQSRWQEPKKGRVAHCGKSTGLVPALRMFKSSHDHQRLAEEVQFLSGADASNCAKSTRLCLQAKETKNSACTASVNCSTKTQPHFVIDEMRLFSFSENKIKLTFKRK